MTLATPSDLGLVFSSAAKIPQRQATEPRPPVLSIRLTPDERVDIAVFEEAVERIEERLTKTHKESQAREAAEREARIRKGLLGFWDRLTSRRRTISWRTRFRPNWRRSAIRWKARALLRRRATSSGPWMRRRPRCWSEAMPSYVSCGMISGT